MLMVDTNVRRRVGTKARGSWEINHGGVSGRTTQQFINYLIGQGQ